MKDKLGIIVGIGVVSVVIVTMYFFVRNAGKLELNEILPIGIVLILVVSVIYILWDRIKNIKEGFPVADERLKSVGYRAAYYGFIAAIWSAVGSNMLSIILFDQELRGGLVTAAVVLISGLVFILSYLYLATRGKLE